MRSENEMLADAVAGVARARAEMIRLRDVVGRLHGLRRIAATEMALRACELTLGELADILDGDDVPKGGLTWSVEPVDWAHLERVQREREYQNNLGGPKGQ